MMLTAPMPTAQFTLESSFSTTGSCMSANCLAAAKILPKGTPSTRVLGSSPKWKNRETSGMETCSASFFKAAS